MEEANASGWQKAGAFDFDFFLNSEQLSDVSTAYKTIQGHRVAYVAGEFWTSGQRQAANLHEVSYRACFKPQLPAYFIKRYSSSGDVVYDPFSGRGTTAIEAALWGRNIIANDVNPLSAILAFPRLIAPCISEIEERLKLIPYDSGLRSCIDLRMFYHRDTEAELVSLRNYLMKRKQGGTEDGVDLWIRMVATNRLTGHSPGFFSVYTLPPNQAVSQVSQIRINEKRNQTPPYRDTKAIILKKSKQLLKGLTLEQLQMLRSAQHKAVFLTGDACVNHAIPDNHVQLTVTSPPFLDVVQYTDDNWLRCWFNDISMDDIEKKITIARSIEKWSEAMGKVLAELYRITKPGGYVAFEVGEVRKKSINLDEYIVPLGIDAGFACQAVMINTQEFTKTANIWGVGNNDSGTNSNRIVVFQKLSKASCGKVQCRVKKSERDAHLGTKRDCQLSQTNNRRRT